MIDRSMISRAWAVMGELLVAAARGVLQRTFDAPGLAISDSLDSLKRCTAAPNASPRLFHFERAAAKLVGELAHACRFAVDSRIETFAGLLQQRGGGRDQRIDGGTFARWRRD